MVVAALVDFVALEGRPNEDRQHQPAVLPRELGQREHRARAGPLAAGADQDDDGVLLQERFHLALGFRQGLPGHLRIVPGAQAAGVRGPMSTRSSGGTSVNENSLVSRKRVATAARSRSAYLGIGFLGDREVLFEQRLDRPEDVAAAAARAQEKESNPHTCLSRPDPESEGDDHPTASCVRTAAHERVFAERLLDPHDVVHDVPLVIRQVRIAEPGLGRQEHIEPRANRA